ncbi:MAG: TonB-dependent receptor [Bacteroidetes bacterium]|nr:TonB-dependent receptor [Bacteroidota bacterium]
MRKTTIALLICCAFSFAALAQPVTLSGNVRNNNTQDAVASVSVMAKGTSLGTFTDAKGNFSLSVAQLPVVLVFSSVNYETQEVTVTSSSQTLQVNISPIVQLGQEVVVSASRYAERILESPVTIERVSATTIKNSSSSNYYDIITNLKGVDVVASSMTFKTPTTRGFNTSGNVRFNQIVDGMDNQAPGLNFSVGSVIGLTELDVESMELLPGASSALYGPGGMNGTLLINSKNPFKYPGLSFQVKTGVMHTDGRTRDISPYYNWSLRWAQKLSEKFAFKIGTELIQAKDWVADDYRNYHRVGTSGTIGAGTRATDPGYDGVNVYGDETTNPAIPTFRTILGSIGAAVPFWTDYVNSILPGVPTDQKISRTGYTENEVANPNTVNFKLSGALHYKITDHTEAILSGYWGTGNTVYTGSDRYSLKDLKVGQYKLEVNNKNWFLRGYTTQENAGESHNLVVTTQLFNEAWKPSSQWYQEYAFAYLNAKLAGRPDMDAHNIARSTADQGRPAAGSQKFKDIFEEVRKRPIPKGGLFLDKSDLWMAEGQYNFTDVIKVAEVLVGGNWKQYVLNSKGTLFPDTLGKPIRINELGAYIQIGKEIVKDVLKIAASGRYDKNENFQGHFTPRVTAVIKPAKDHNIRLSFQTAYRFPSTQMQFINLNTGTGIIIGADKSIWEGHNLMNNAPYDISTSTPTQIPYKEVKPESLTSFEVGYKGLIQMKFLIDLYGYYGQYKDFLSRMDVVQYLSGAPGPGAVQGYSIVLNSPQKVKTFGWGASAEWLLPSNFSVSGNISSDRLTDVPANFSSSFNSPKLRTVLSLNNTGIGHKRLIGFNIIYRWQSSIEYQSDFADGTVPEINVVDASVNFKCPKIKTLIKVGANNLFNSYYRTGIGNPSIGGLYYVSFAYNVL